MFIPRKTAFQQAQLARATKQILLKKPEVSAYFASPEDTILAKLDWFHMGGDVSERQWRDVLGILKVRAGDLDLDYLRKWAGTLNLSELFEKAFKESI